MKITKEKLKQIIKEELGGIMKEYDPREELDLPQGAELDQALNPSLPSDIPALRAQVQNLYDTTQGLDPHARYAPGQMQAIQNHLLELEQMIRDLEGEFQ